MMIIEYEMCICTHFYLMYIKKCRSKYKKGTTFFLVNKNGAYIECNVNCIELDDIIKSNI